MKAMTKKAIVQAIYNDDGNAAWVDEKGMTNFGQDDEYVTAEMCMKLQDEGHLVFDYDYYCHPKYA